MYYVYYVFPTCILYIMYFKHVLCINYYVFPTCILYINVFQTCIMYIMYFQHIFCTLCMYYVYYVFQTCILYIMYFRPYNVELGICGGVISPAFSILGYVYLVYQCLDYLYMLTDCTCVALTMIRPGQGSSVGRASAS